MIRFAWLQARTQALIAALVLVAVAIAAAITGVRLAHIYATTVAPCRVRGGCSPAVASFLSHDQAFGTALTDLVLITPALIGIFYGAPLLARELETGTFRLVWTQSITRTRWLATRLALVGLVSVAVAGLLSLTVTWWFRSTDLVSANRLDPSVFGERGIVLVGYAAFAFAVGVLAGAVVRHTLVAMAVTLAAYACARAAVTFWLRPNLFTAAHTTVPVSAAGELGFTATGAGPIGFYANRPNIPNAWVLSSKLVDASGRPAGSAAVSQFIRAHCPAIANPGRNAGGSPTAFRDCTTQLSGTFHLSVTYLPANRYWPLQWSETAIFVGLAALAVAASFWWIHRGVG